MGLIIKNKIQQLMRGYPTISDKYDVAPAVLEGAGTVTAGAPVTLGSIAGRYKASTLMTDTVAGFVLATNVKVPDTYPASTELQTYGEGEAFNLMIRGFIACPLDSGATTAEMVNGKQVALMAGGKLTTADKATGGSATATVIPDAYFTGCIETVNGEVLAEISFRL